MAVKTRDEILEAVRSRIGDNTDDESIAFLEDITDTFTDLEEKAKGDGTDWEAKYKENDEEWRKRYTERFYSSEPEQKEQEPKEPEPEKPKTFSDLFTTDK